VWERQWRLNQKRDIYARLLESMSDLELSVSVLSKYFAMQSTEYISDQVHKHNERATQVGRKLERAMAVAKVYLPQNAIAALQDLALELRKPAPELEYSAVCLALARAQEGLTSAAKADLSI
jgi:O-acetylhomoserine/O-acetylserine sulfhydrylase-like pyridoxal-dependent enzyme